MFNLTNFENINKEKTKISIDYMDISKIEKYRNIINSCSVESIKLDAYIDTFEFIEGGWNITTKEKSESYTVMGFDDEKIELNIDANFITRSTDKINKIKFKNRNIIQHTVTIDSWDTANYNPLSSLYCEHYIFGSSFVPVLKFKGSVTLDCSDSSVTTLSVKSEAKLYGPTFNLAEDSNITKIVFEKNVTFYDLEDFSFNYNNFKNIIYNNKKLECEYLGSIHAAGPFKVENSVPSDFLIVNKGQVSFKNIGKKQKIKGKFTIEEFEDFLNLENLPKIVVDKNTVDPEIYEIDLMDNTDVSADDYLNSNREYDKVYMDSCGKGLLEVYFDNYKKNQFLIFESTKSFEEMEKIVKFTNNKLSLKIKDAEFTFEKELKNMVYSSKGDEYSNRQYTRGTKEEKYFANQYYLKIGSISGDFIESGKSGESGKKNNLSGPEIAGIAVGCVAFVVIIVVVSIVICKYKKKKDSSSNSK